MVGARRHDAEVEPNGNGQARTRWTDATVLRYGRLAAALLALVALILLVLNAFGWKRYNPEDDTRRVAAKVDTTRLALQAEIDTLRHTMALLQLQHEPLEEGVTILIRDACTDPMKTLRDKQRVGLIDKNGYCIR